MLEDDVQLHRCWRSIMVDAIHAIHGYHFIETHHNVAEVSTKADITAFWSMSTLITSHVANELSHLIIMEGQSPEE